MEPVELAMLAKKECDMSDLNILLVEDDIIVQRVHQSMLNKLGCSVDLAMTGKAALKMVKSNMPYKIIFVDIGLPDITGFEVIKKITAINKKEDQDPVIYALTGYAGEPEKQACLAAGAHAVLAKPIISSEMRELLDQYKE
jgi:two-component system aerobic respiration control sensor histidine kinase ArcB